MFSRHAPSGPVLPRRLRWTLPDTNAAQFGKFLLFNINIGIFSERPSIARCDHGLTQINSIRIAGCYHPFINIFRHCCTLHRAVTRQFCHPSGVGFATGPSPTLGTTCLCTLGCVNTVDTIAGTIHVNGIAIDDPHLRKRAGR